MIEISFNKVSKNYGFKNVLDNISFEIKTNEKVALIGDNGCGKTTIIKLITKEEYPTSGTISVRSNIKLGILRQDNYDDLNEYLVKSIIYKSFNELDNIKNKMEKLEKEMSSSDGKKLDKLIIKYTELQDIFIKKGGYEIETKIDKIISLFNVNNLMDKYYYTLSGGEKRIVNLICLILNEPDMLILDEPTNHLDINMIEYLEKYLNNYKGTLLIISHDRYFLDKVVNKIILIEDGRENIFHGNYTYYVKENENRILNEFNEYKTYEKKVEEMKKAIKKLREFGQKAYPLGERFYRRAKSMEKRLEKMEKVKKPKQKSDIPINFDVNLRSGNDVLVINNLSYNYGDKIIFKNASCSIHYKERVCLFSLNGKGKSTLLRLIMEGFDGIKLGSNLKIGYIDQNIKFDDENITVFDEAKKYVIGEEHIIRSKLFKYLFYDNDIYKRLSKLSFGERLRLKIFCLVNLDNNFLILDEVTNHLDINTKELLEDALNKFDGTILFVSHDRYFINNIATRIIEIKDNKFYSYIGNYDDYKH